MNFSCLLFNSSYQKTDVINVKILMSFFFYIEPLKSGVRFTHVASLDSN